MEEKLRIKNGKVWVKDPSRKGGGYWRKLGKGAKKVGGAIASQLLGAAVVGAGAAAVASQAIKKGKGEAKIAANDIAKRFGSEVNRKVIAGAALGGLAVGAAGTAAIASRNRKRKDSVKAAPDEKMHRIMKRYKKGKLHIGKSNKIVKNRKQAIAIGLEVSGKSTK